MRHFLIPFFAVALIGLLSLAAGAQLADASTGSAAQSTASVPGKLTICRQVQLTKERKVRRTRAGYARVAYKGTPKKLRRRSCFTRSLTLTLPLRKPKMQPRDYGGHSGIATIYGCDATRMLDHNVFIVANPYRTAGWPGEDLIEPRTYGTESDVSFSCGRFRLAPLEQSFSCDMDDTITGANHNSWHVHVAAHCTGGGGDMYPVEGDFRTGFGEHPFSWLAPVNAESGWVTA